MGVEFAKAALAAGHNVAATGRNPDAIREALGPTDELLAVELDVTSPADSESAVKAAVDRFGGIDVLVNNAATFYAGYFEELTPEQMERQPTTSLIGPMNVTRAVLPVMRKQRSGHVMMISSSAGLAGFAYGTAYAASKFGVDGWMESLAPEVEPQRAANCGHGLRVGSNDPAGSIPAKLLRGPGLRTTVRCSRDDR